MILFPVQVSLGKEGILYLLMVPYGRRWCIYCDGPLIMEGGDVFIDFLLWKEKIYLLMFPYGRRGYIFIDGPVWEERIHLMMVPYQ